LLLQVPTSAPLTNPLPYPQSFRASFQCSLKRHPSPFPPVWVLEDLAPKTTPPWFLLSCPPSQILVSFFFFLSVCGKPKSLGAERRLNRQLLWGSQNMVTFLFFFCLFFFFSFFSFFVTSFFWSLFSRVVCGLHLVHGTYHAPK